MGNRADRNPWLKDGSTEFSAGVDFGRRPGKIQGNQVSLLINGTARWGRLGPRPGWKKLALSFESGTDTLWKNGRFQEGAYYDGGGSPFLISAHGGRFFRLDLQTLKVMEITPTRQVTVATVSDFTLPTHPGSATLEVTNTAGADARITMLAVAGYDLQLSAVVDGTHLTVTNLDPANDGKGVATGAEVVLTVFDVSSSRQEIGWSCQVENYWVYQDNLDYPMIYNGGVSRRANPSRNEIPVGNVMVEAMGRLIVALPDRKTMVGDLVFGSSGTSVNGYRDSVLRFTENDYLNEGGTFTARVFGAPSNAGEIRAMKAAAMTDTALGQGAVQVGTPNMVFSLNLPFDRTKWKDTANALQTANPIVGPLSNSACVMVNSDLWYRSMDGIRSWVMAQRLFNGSWGNTALSAEIGPLLAGDTDSLLEHGSAVLFDNRLLMTTSPVKTEHGVYHRGLVVLDFNTISGLRERRNPAWEGVWTGLRVLKIVTGMVEDRERCFMYVLNDASEIEVWELTKAAQTDWDGRTTTPISWEVQFKGYDFGDADRLKRLETGRLILLGVSGTVTGTVEYRTDGGVCWQPWDTINLCARNQDCGPFSCEGPVTYADQPRWPIKFHRPPEPANPISGKFDNTGYSFQPRLKLTGHAEVEEFRLYALDAPEGINAEEGPG